MINWFRLPWGRTGHGPISEPVMPWFNSLRPRQNERHLADDFFKSNFLNENVLISIKTSLKFVPKGPINNIPALVEIMAWHRPGDKPLSEPRMESLLTHICFNELMTQIFIPHPSWANFSWGVVDNETKFLAFHAHKKGWGNDYLSNKYNSKYE